MSEYTKKQLSKLEENVEIFKAAGLNWISALCNKEYNCIKKQVTNGTRK